MVETSVENFKKELLSRPLDRIIEEYVLDGVPYVFRERPEVGETLFAHLSDALELSRENMRIVGSAKLGFSVSPDNFPRRFSEASDIDVFVVDERLFDEIWANVLKWHYPRRPGLVEPDRTWMRSRRREVYWGSVHPDKIKYDGLSFPSALRPIRDFSSAWFDAFHSLSIYPEFVGRDVSGRLYRTWLHARLYLSYGLGRIKESLENGAGG